MSRNEQDSAEISTIRENLKKPVVIVGMMGSGKTRIGKKLASLLKVDFFDTDRLIEEKAGYSINEIFEIDGEAKFREVEKKTVMELLSRGPCVISTGGGAVMIEGVSAALKQKAVTIWLRAAVADILQRVENTRSRPLLKENPEKAVCELLEKREPFYAQADITVDTVHGSLESTVRAAIKGLYGFLKGSSF